MTHHERPPRPPRRTIGRFGALASVLDLGGATAPSGRRAGLALVACALSIAAVAPSLASAKQARLFAGTFGEATSTPANPYPLSDAGKIAVDESSHDAYVADPPNHRVEKFDSGGQFLFMIGLEVNKTAVEESATRKGEENVCPATGHPADVCQAGQPGSTPGAFVEPVALAVDNSVGGSRGDLYVANTGAVVGDEQTLSEQSPEGTFTLTVENETTAPIEAHAPPGGGPGSVEAALQALAKIGGAVHVAGTVGDYSIIFSRGGTTPKMYCDNSKLRGFTLSNECHVTIKEQVEKFDSSGHPVASWGEAGEFTASGVADPPAPVAGPFRNLRGLAVDQSGNLWVSTAAFSDAGELVYEFREDATFVTGWAGRSGELAVDGADDLYFDFDNVVREFTAGGTEFGVVAPSSRELVEEDNNFQVNGVAVDAVTGDVYVGGEEGSVGSLTGIVKRYDSSCHPVITHEVPEPGCKPVESFGAELLDGSKHPLAIDSETKALYVGDGKNVAAFSFQTVPDVATTKPEHPTAASATLTATVNPGGVELNAGQQGCRFEWGETTAPYEHTASCDKTAAQIGTATEPVEVQAQIAGLQPGKTYHYRLVASNANDVNSSITEPSFGADVAFGPPLLESASALDVTATSAELQAQVNPNDLDTHVTLEYGTEAGVYPQSAPATDIGSAGTVQAPTFEVLGLVPGVVYHYRVVAQNVLGEGAEAVVGSDHAFTTQAPSSFSLLDERGLELVSPPAKHGAKLEPPSGYPQIQAAADGSAISYAADAPTESGVAGNGGQSQILSTRTGSGWQSRDIATPISAELGTNVFEYLVFSSDLSLGIVQPRGVFAPEISPEASEQTPYLRTDFVPSEVGGICTSGCYRPLVTGAPGFANVLPGTKFGFEPSPSFGTTGFDGVHFVAASPDARHIVLESEAPLEEGAPTFGLYEWTEGRLQLISILPGAGGPSTSAQIGSGNSSHNVISSDGSRVIWSEMHFTGDVHLFLRDTATGETLQLDLNKGGSGKGSARPVFQAASSDDSVILFTDQQQLTPGSGAASGKQDLYRCEVVTGESGELECALTDLTPANGAEGADVQGDILGAGEDGSSVYFVADGVLAHNRVDNGAGPEEATPGTCAALNPPEGATCNLYLSRNGTPVFITSLSQQDAQDWGLEGGLPDRVSPDGQWLALMSQRSLTGYDNRDRATGQPVAEVYIYDASAGPSGTLRCVSCDPSGARPRGVPYKQLEPGTGAGGIDSNGALPNAQLVNASLPTWNSPQGGLHPYQDRYLSDSGRLFFNAVDALVPEDTNAAQDVYEYEPPGVGTCNESSATFTVGSSGCVGLISSGASSQPSGFLDASENGDDVFFMTATKLSPRDTDGAYDVYDARVGGGDREPEKPIECQGDACQGFVEAPNDATPGSLIFSGPGNLKPLAATAPPAKRPPPKPKKCGKGKKLKHHKCVRTKKAGKQRARKTTDTRRPK